MRDLYPRILSALEERTVLTKRNLCQRSDLLERFANANNFLICNKNLTGFGKFYNELVNQGIHTFEFWNIRRFVKFAEILAKLFFQCDVESPGYEVYSQI